MFDDLRLFNEPLRIEDEFQAELFRRELVDLSADDLRVIAANLFKDVLQLVRDREELSDIIEEI